MDQATMASHMNRGRKHETAATAASNAIPIGEFMKAGALKTSSDATADSTAKKHTSFRVLNVVILWALKIMNSHYSFKPSEDMSCLFTAMFLDIQKKTEKEN